MKCEKVCLRPGVIWLLEGFFGRGRGVRSPDHRVSLKSPSRVVIFVPRGRGSTRGWATKYTNEKVCSENDSKVFFPF